MNIIVNEKVVQSGLSHKLEFYLIAYELGKGKGVQQKREESKEKEIF